MLHISRMGQRWGHFLGICWVCLLSLGLSVAEPEPSPAPSAFPSVLPVVSSLPKPKYGPQSNPKATPLSQDSDYFRGHWAHDFWAMIPYYTAQQNDASCSVASVAMILNAARSGRKKSPALIADDRLITQNDILEKVKILQWKDRVTPESNLKTKGLSLDQLFEVTKSAVQAYGLELSGAELLRPDDAGAKPFRKEDLLKLLTENENGEDDFLLANFSQRSFTDDSEVGHIAPVGAFDETTKRVLILDPDRQWYEPYWVSLDAFWDGISTKDPTNENKSRGLIRLRFVPSNVKKPSPSASPSPLPSTAPSAVPQSTGTDNK